MNKPSVHHQRAPLAFVFAFAATCHAGDAVVDGADLGLLIGQWSTAGPTGDLNCDGTVDGADLGLLLASWGPC